MRGTVLVAFAVLGADQLADLHLHQLLHDPAQALAQKVDPVFLKQVADDLLNSHPLRLGHRGAPFVDPLAGPTSLSAAVAGLPGSIRHAPTPI